MRYRKKPIVVEAQQLIDDDSGDNSGEIAAWCGGTAAAIWRMTESPPRLIARVIVHTLEGDMYAVPGDWIIKGVQGEYYPCKPAIFEQTYEATHG